MPPPFQPLSTAEFARLLERFPFKRQITSIHMHHTWRPNHSQYHGHDSIVSMWRSHTQERGFSDIAQHLSIAPKGVLWTGRNWNAAPASAVGHNGNAFSGPFMFETIGDFDRGEDPLAGDQRMAVLDVVKLLQERFQLPVESLLFHNQMSKKSCPGTSIDRVAFLAELRAHPMPTAAKPRRGARSGPFGPEALASNAAAEQALARLTAKLDGARSADPPDAELDYDDESWSAAIEERDLREGARTLGAEEIDALRPHVVNLRGGALSSEGLMTTTPEDVAAIFEERLPRWIGSQPDGARPARVVFFAHGGLVAESRGLGIVRGHIGWWKRNGVYPIYFVWETGLFETIGQLLERTRAQSGIGGPGERGVFTDWISDPLVEEAVRALQAPRIWGGMKASARLASAPEGGAILVVQHLRKFLADHPGAVELHAVGHSAGAIFHTHFLPACSHEAGASFRTLQLLAPAVTSAAFADHVVPLAGASPGVEHVTVFTMRRAFEEADGCAGVYRKSLLYLVSEACEPKRGTPILGLETSLRADPGLKGFFGLGGPPSPVAEVVWSKSDVEDGRSASRSTTHGGFDDDAATMNSVLRRVLGKADGDPVEPYPAVGGRGVVSWLSEVDWPASLRRPARPTVTGSAAAGAPAATTAATAAVPSSGRRQAVCIGINTYPSQPLSGCVADAKLWAETLRGLDFATTLVTDGEATRARIVDELSRMIRDSKAGDTLVFQYAGHGTQVDDLDGDEAGGDTPGKDEAIVPVDYASGAFVIDDDVAAEVAKLRDGVRLTFLLDCCHSGTGSRFAMSSAIGAQAAVGVKARLLPATPAMLEAHRRFRSSLSLAPAARGTGAGAAAAIAAMREVTFAACQSKEVAYEVDGQGEFTRRAHDVLRSAPGSFTNAGFYEAVLRAFGPSARQRPHLDCDVSLRDAPWLGVGR